MTKEIDTNHHMIVFKDKNIRRVLHNGEWWFVVKDIIETLIDTSNSTDYIKKMRARDPALSEGWGQIVTPLSIETLGGKQTPNTPCKKIHVLSYLNPSNLVFQNLAHVNED